MRTNKHENIAIPLEYVLLLLPASGPELLLRLISPSNMLRGAGNTFTDPDTRGNSRMRNAG